MTHDSWKPLSVSETAHLLHGFPARWWIDGGIALDLYAGRSLRDHGDTDVLVLRDDQHAIREHLPTWDIQVAHGGRFEPFHGHVAPPRSHLWARSTAGSPWQLQFHLGEHEDGTWSYRRDPKIRIPVVELGAQTTAGIPYVRPEVILLFKSAHPEPKDEADFAAIAPLLDDHGRRRLRSWLPPRHPWEISLGPAP